MKLEKFNLRLGYGVNTPLITFVEDCTSSGNKTQFSFSLLTDISKSDKDEKYIIRFTAFILKAMLNRNLTVNVDFNKVDENGEIMKTPIVSFVYTDCHWNTNEFFVENDYVYNCMMTNFVCKDDADKPYHGSYSFTEEKMTTLLHLLEQ